MSGAAEPEGPMFAMRRCLARGVSVRTYLSTSGDSGAGDVGGPEAAYTKVEERARTTVRDSLILSQTAN